MKIHEVEEYLDEKFTRIHANLSGNIKKDQRDFFIISSREKIMKNL